MVGLLATQIFAHAFVINLVFCADPAFKSTAAASFGCFLMRISHYALFGGFAMAVWRVSL
jgi:hypothetical protein